MRTDWIRRDGLMRLSAEHMKAIAMTDGTKLEAAFARLEGVVTTEIKHLSHDLKNITMKLEAYPTQRDLDAVSSRVEALEEKTRWAWRTGVGFALSVIGSAIAAWIKFGH